MKTSDSGALPRGWLAFELNVLRRIHFGSAVFPLFGEPALGAYLKRLGARVVTNDLLQSNWTRAVAFVQNNNEVLTEDQVAVALEGASVPRPKLYNPALRNWFNETDSFWFDNLRANIEQLETPFARAVALSVGITVGDYVLSFDEQTEELRQPLSHVFRRVWSNLQPPFDNGKNNSCHNREPTDFLVETYADLLFLRLPRPHNTTARASLGWTAWREEWTRGTDAFWDSLEMTQAGRVGTHVQTGSQYLRHLENLLQSAAHLKKWAIAHVADGFIAAEELIETVSKLRPVDTVFTKDFSEFGGAKALIITA